MPKTVFQSLMDKKIKAFRGKYPEMHSAHEGLALLAEELHELRKDVYKRKNIKDPNKFLNELVDIAAYCEIFAEDRLKWRPGRNHK